MRSILLLVSLVYGFAAFGQVGIGTTTPDTSAALEVQSATKGVLPPRLNTIQRDNLVTTIDSKGLIIFNSDTGVLNIFDGVHWHAIAPEEVPSICNSVNTYADILNCLQINYTPDQTLGYSSARDILYSTIDINTATQELNCVYTDYAIIMDYATDPDPSIHAFNLGINAEHVYPQSMGAGDEPARSDMFNIFPSRVDVNSSRSNCPYDEIVDANVEVWFYLNQQMGTIPNSNIDAYTEKDNNTSFPLLSAGQQCAMEPREDKKGDLARAIFYFYAIYNSSNANGYISYANDNFFDVMKTTLLQWHSGDPVDAIEMARNNAIKTHQGNDNPFVLDATLAGRLFN
jgi:hypothetical protein